MANSIEVDEKDITTIIAEDLEIKGTVKFKGSLMIKGILEGEIISEGLLVVGPTAKVTATITTKDFISHGEVTGNVTATEMVILKNTSVHKGDITTPRITIENGALFNGSCIMERSRTVKEDIPKVEEVQKVEQKEESNESSTTSQGTLFGSAEEQPEDKGRNWKF